ncbi:hypothetical protein KJ616_00950 [Patescibacteria group bacterium]|nr:hypothetical protein [Patescibacteria group bacterium]
MNSQKGFIITYILVFGSVFLVLLVALLGFILSQIKQAKYELAYEQSLHIAEAGLNRYRWYLLHKEQELFGGIEIGCPPSDCASCAPCEYEYNLPGVGVIGRYRLDVVEERPCDITTSIQVTSTGWTDQFPNADRTIRVYYIKPTVAEYSYILNHNVWAGEDRIIMGPYHSNGGIRMDGQNNSFVSSEQEQWVCTDSYGCSSCPQECTYSPSQGCVCPGVFTTANGNEDLFRIGVSHFDFEGITIDLGTIKGLAKPPPEGQGKGLYLPPSNAYGYHVIINQRQLSVKKVERVSAVYTYDTDLGYFWEYSIIDRESAAVNYNLSDCGLVFIEDNVWLQGTVSGKITLAVADLITPSVTRNVWLKDDIVYLNPDNSDSLVVMGQNNVLITPDSPNYLDLHGVFIAQIGHFARNYYSPYTYPSYAKKEQLNIFGSIISNGRVGTKWTSSGVWVSGYKERQNIYDPTMSFSPPPFLPSVSEEFSYKKWEEIQ